MAEILSEQEMTALLAETRASAAGPSPAKGRVEPFSFTAPMPFAPEALERIAALGARFAETLRARLASELRREVGVVVSPVEVLGSADAGQIVSGGVHLSFETNEGRRAADFVLETELALEVIESRLGGRIAEPQPRRPLTPVEMRLLARLMGACGGPALAASFGTGARREAEDSSSGAGEGRAARAAAAATTTAGGTAARSPQAPGARAASVAEAVSEAIECVPGAGIEPAGSGFAAIPLQLSLESRGGMATLFLAAGRAAAAVALAATQRPHTPGRRISTATIAKLPVRVVPRIPGGAISLRDLMELKAGLVVRLDQRDEDPIEILTNGEPSLRGRLIRAGSATAIEIAGWAEEESLDEESQ